MPPGPPPRAALVAALTARSARAVDDITALVEERVDRLAADPESARWIRTSARTNVELLLQVMAQPGDLARVQPPLGGVALVRRAAQREVPFYELVRGYQLAEWYWGQLCLRELAALTTDRDALVAEAAEVSALRAHLAARCSATVTARALNCHKNTVQYRIRTAEALLGHPVDQGGPGLELALLADRWLGDAVRPVPVSPGAP